jgi:pyruvate kinase
MHHSFLPRAKTKIVATLGPSTSTPETIATMLEQGMTVARCNMSHGDHESHAANMAAARAAAKKAGRPVAILQDLSGPKIRIGDFSTETVTLVEGQTFILTNKPCVGNETRASVNYKKLPQEVTVGDTIFLNDGKLTLTVREHSSTEIVTEVVHGGTIRGRRGVNVPDGMLSIPTLTPKDKKDLVFGLEQQVDFVTLSFVRSGKDVEQLKKLIKKHKPESDVMVVAKIETKQAIADIDAIIAAADAIMVARGDLAIEVPPEQVPLLQKRIIRAANHAGKPVITATQMMDSMRTSPVPTRAEVNDVANAIFDGTDAVMLSDESAVGEYPAKAVAMMAKIARNIEQSELFLERADAWDFPPRSQCEAVSRAISKTVVAMQAKAIVALSESGYTGRTVARHRPHVPILVLTENEQTYNQSLITFGCLPILLTKTINTLTDAQRVARETLKKRGLASDGDVFVLGAGIPFGKPGATNTMLVERV